MDVDDPETLEDIKASAECMINSYNVSIKVIVATYVCIYIIKLWYE